MNQITLEFLSIFCLHPGDTIALTPRVQVAPATWKPLALPNYLITRPHSIRHFCHYGHNHIIHICAHSVTFCHQSFIFSFLICRLVPCLVLYWHWLNKVGLSSLVIKDVWQEYTEVQMVQESWMENNCSFWDPKKQRELKQTHCLGHKTSPFLDSRFPPLAKRHSLHSCADRAQLGQDIILLWLSPAAPSASPFCVARWHTSTLAFFTLQPCST